MQPDYKPFVDRMIQQYEGGYGWNSKDPGGPTKYGITCFDLAEHRGQRMTSMTAWAPLVRDMPLSEAEDIYAEKYATAIRFNDLPAGVDCTVMDYAVNSGIGRAALVARALTKSTSGSTFDAILVDAIRAYGSEKFVNDMCDERLRYMHAIRNGTAWDEFGKGWGARVADLRQYSEALVHAVPATKPPDLSHVPTPKVTHTANSSGTADAGKVIVATGTAGAAKAAGVPTLIIVGGLVVAVAGVVAYEVWKTYRAHAANQVVHV